ncbi:unnamed protein product [Pleuronectes platessa]|uniref:Uncharacterized protein n=1 Tax=Pleuronectes platessa TaxID=8262 RepID=A0A9N7V3I7_PLEPL|nr:unnamed protein product [Pleuronectes platessa]
MAHFVFDRMKFAAAFLVLSIVVLMAEPGECFIGALIKGAIHGVKTIHGLIHGHGEQQELAKRSDDDSPTHFVFDRMKFAAAFLVLSMVVLMSGPGECGSQAISNGLTGFLHGMNQGRQSSDEQQELDKRLDDDSPSLIFFD